MISALGPFITKGDDWSCAKSCEVEMAVSKNQGRTVLPFRVMGLGISWPFFFPGFGVQGLGPPQRDGQVPNFGFWSTRGGTKHGKLEDLSPRNPRP